VAQHDNCEVSVSAFMEPRCGMLSLSVIRIECGVYFKLHNAIQRDVAAVSLIITCALSP